MKEGWTYKKLGEVCNIIGGGTPDKKNHSFYNGLIPWATVRDMNCEVLSSTEFSITEDGLNNSASHIIKKGEIIIATRVGLGKICKLAQDTAINQDLKGIIPKKEIIDRGFLFYYFKDKAKYIESNGVGATVKGVKLKFIEDLPFPLIGIHEQKKIVERLDAAFAQIDELKANAEKQLAEARALFQKALAKAMEPKEGWEEKALGDVCSLSQGLAINSHTKHLFIQNGSLPLLRIKDMKEGTREIFVDEANCPQGCIASEEDIIYTRTGTLGLVFTGMHGVLHNNCFKIKHDINKLNKSFLIYFLRNDSFVKTIIGLASRAAQPDITHKLFKAQEIHFPPLAEQQRIVERLDALSENIRKYEEFQRQIISECDALKQALLRQVFE